MENIKKFTKTDCLIQCTSEVSGVHVLTEFSLPLVKGDTVNLLDWVLSKDHSSQAQALSKINKSNDLMLSLSKRLIIRVDQTTPIVHKAPALLKRNPIQDESVLGEKKLPFIDANNNKGKSISAKIEKFEQPLSKRTPQAGLGLDSMGESDDLLDISHLSTTDEIPLFSDKEIKGMHLDTLTLYIRRYGAKPVEAYQQGMTTRQLEKDVWTKRATQLAALQKELNVATATA